MRFGAGIIIVCPRTEKVLLGLRNEMIPTWANFGGGVEKNETYIECVRREVKEEAGLLEGDYHFFSKKPISCNVFNNFEYKCFLGLMDSSKKLILNKEHLEYAWFSIDQLPDNLHHGVRRVFDDVSVKRKIVESIDQNKI
jgi:8-oxo-dGTP pyrophosphatase MutT (NUDIX family)